MKGCLITFIGPSGVGKSEILNQIDERFPDLLSRSISTTTRKKRNEESDLDYHFISEEDFHKMIARGDFLEYNNYVGNYYGTSFESVIPLLEEGRRVIKIIEVNGLKAIKDSKRVNGLKHIAIFIDAPTREERENRIINRGKLLDGEIIARIETGDNEREFFKNNPGYFDHLIINDNLDRAVEEVLDIIRNLNHVALV